MHTWLQGAQALSVNTSQLNAHVTKTLSTSPTVSCPLYPRLCLPGVLLTTSSLEQRFHDIQVVLKSTGELKHYSSSEGDPKEQYRWKVFPVTELQVDTWLSTESVVREDRK